MPRAPLPILLAFSVACGAPAADLHAAFSRIQVDEARIEGEAAQPSCQAPECPETCAAAEDLCGVAAPTADRDALARCDRARERCAHCRDERRACQESP